MKPNNDSADNSNGQKPLRCICGNLVARLVPQGVELKCRRCKRYVIVPLESTSRKKIEPRI